MARRKAVAWEWWERIISQITRQSKDCLLWGGGSLHPTLRFQGMGVLSWSGHTRWWRTTKLAGRRVLRNLAI